MLFPVRCGGLWPGLCRGSTRSFGNCEPRPRITPSQRNTSSSITSELMRMLTRRTSRFRRGSAGCESTSQSLRVRPSDLKVSLGGVALEWWRIKYAGLTPGSAGLYQINLLLPDNPGTDPELLVTVGDPTTAAGLKLAVR